MWFRENTGLNMHLNSKLIFEKYAKQYFQNGMKVLEIGPDEIPSAYQELINNVTIEWQTLDIGTDVSNVTIHAKNEYSYEVADNTYDIVVSNNVIEHVRKIWLWMKELHRITRPGGYVITVNPLSWPYHEAPVDCWRIYPEGMKALCEEANLKVVLCTYETLEIDHFNLDRNFPTYGGESLYWYSKKKQDSSKISWNKFVRKLPFLKEKLIPLEVAYDTITIAMK
jgi:SAM-dependent methyltransferase